MTDLLRILIVEDSDDDAFFIQREIRRNGYRLESVRVDTPEELLEQLSSGTWDLVTSDHMMPHLSAPESVRIVRESKPELPVVIVSGEIDIALAVSLLKAGAEDYVQKSQMALLVPAIERALSNSRVRAARARADEERKRTEELYSSVVREIPHAIYQIGRDGKIVFVNEAFISLFARDDSRFIGTPVCRILSPDDPEACSQEDEQVMSSDTKLSSMRELALPSTGQKEYFEIAKVPLHSSDGSVSGMQGIYWQVSARVRALSALRLAEFSIQNTTEEVYWLRLDGLILFANNAACKALGYSSEELVGKYVWDVDARSKNGWPSLVETLKIHKSAQRESMHKNAEGEDVVVDVLCTLAEFEGEAYIFASCRDIRDRKLAEEAKESAARLFRQLFDQSIEANLLLEEGKFVEANPAAVAMLGYESVDQIRGMTPSQLSPEFQPEGARSVKASDDAIQRVLGQVDKENVGARFDWVHKRADGSTFWVEVVLTPVRYNGRSLIYTTWRDITERKNAEESVIENEERFRAFYETVNDCVFVHDCETLKILDVNNRAERLFGYSFDEFQALDIGDIMSPNSPYEPEEARARAHECVRGIPQTFERLLARSDGTEFWAEVNLRVVRLKGQDRVLAVVRDVTERKENESKRRLFELALDRWRDGIFWFDEAGQFIYVNDAAIKQLGYTSEQFAGLTVFDVDPNLKASELPTRLSILASGGFSRRESEHRKLNGDLLPVEVSGHYLEFEGSRGCFCFVRDISGRYRSRAAIRRYAARLAKIHEIDVQALSGQMPDRLGDLTLEHARGLIRSDAGFVILVSRNGRQAHLVASSGDPIDDWPVGLSFEFESVPSQVNNEDPKRPTIIPDLSLRTTHHVIESRLKAQGFRSVVRCPMWVGNDLLGFLYLASNEVASFTDEDKETADSFAMTLAVALELQQRRLGSDKLLREVRSYATRLERIRDIDRAILSSHSLAEISTTALEHFHSILACDRISVATFDTAADSFTVVAVDQKHDGAPRVGDSGPLSAFPKTDDWERGAYIYMPDLAKLSERLPVEETVFRAGIHSVIIMPLVFRGDLLGSVNIGSRSPFAFSDEQIEIAREVSNTLALALATVNRS